VVEWLRVDTVIFVGLIWKRSFWSEVVRLRRGVEVNLERCDEIEEVENEVE